MSLTSIIASRLFDHIYAAMRGETLEQFQRTRNAPGALYSVAGNDAGARQESWDTARTAR